MFIGLLITELQIEGWFVIVQYILDIFLFSQLELTKIPLNNHRIGMYKE